MNSLCQWIFLITSTTLVYSYTVGLVERNLGTSPNWKIARANTFQMDIAHRFVTPLDNAGDWSPVYDEFLGMDGSANIGLSMTYGLANLADVTLTRYRWGKQYKLSSRVKLLDQYVDSKIVSFSTDLNVGYRADQKISNNKTYGYTFILGRFFNSEMLNFNLLFAGQNGVSTVLESSPYPAEWTHSVGANLAMRHNRWTLSSEYFRPLLGFMRENSQQLITDIFGVSLSYRTYQHIFTVSVQNHYFNNFNEMIAGANNSISSHSDLRFGFNIIREFDFLLEDAAKGK